MMVEVEEIELDLELSIGGGRKGTGTVKKTKPECLPAGVAVSGPDLPHMQWVDPQQQHEKRQVQPKRKRGGTDECQSVFKREKKDFFYASCTTSFQQYVPLPSWFPNVGGIIDAVDIVADGKARSNASSRSTSSAVSDYQCEDADSRSHSGNSSANRSHLTAASEEINIRIQPEQTASFNPMRSKHGNNQQDIRNHNDVIKETQTQRDEEAAAVKETKVDMVKSSSKPVTQTSSSLPQMPYVSTKGDGPNGKTVNGFLYRYSKSEVSIICVCHGSTFSPAEFVQHAGGTDISHPLRHIRVIPSAFD